MSHPRLGRPLVLRLAFGSEVPEIAVEDLEFLPVARVESTVEKKIGSLVENATAYYEEAIQLEDEAASIVQRHIRDRLDRIAIDPENRDG